MLQQTKFKILNLPSQDGRAALEAEIEVMKGVKDATINSSGQGAVEFDDQEVSQGQIMKAVQDLGYKIYEPKEESENKSGSSKLKEITYFVQGMHCASCEILIENKLLNSGNIKSVEASTAKGAVTIEYEGDRPSSEHLNKIFKKDNYVFSNHNFQSAGAVSSDRRGLWKNIVIALLIIIGFIALNKLGLAQWVNVDSKSSLPMFFAFGLLAGISSCAALVGGLVLSMSKQWSEVYSNENSTWRKIQPHLLFNAGRLISYGVLGGLLGMIGSKLQLSLTFTSVLILLVSVMMIFLGLQMFGIKAFRKFQFTMPKFFTRYIANEKNFQGKYMPTAMGALTFFLPCGFTITAQGLALLSGSPLQGALIMFLFALGTLPALLLIGFSSVKFSKNPRLSGQFLKVAGIVVLFFALFNINAQLNVLGFSSLSDFKLSANAGIAATGDESSLPPIVDGKQVVKMDASANGYSPNNIKVRVGVPVRWEITDTGTSGCTNAIISKSLFDGSIPLKPGTTSVKEFTPQKVGKYKFSCWMGMVSGIIEVIDAKATQNIGITAANAAGANDVIPSGAKGCGCGGGGGSSCGAQ